MQFRMAYETKDGSTFVSNPIDEKQYWAWAVPYMSKRCYYIIAFNQGGQEFATKEELDAFLSKWENEVEATYDGGDFDISTLLWMYGDPTGDLNDGVWSYGWCGESFAPIISCTEEDLGCRDWPPEFPS